MAVIKKLKRRQATGPDEVPVEIMKEMDDESLDEIVSEELLDELAYARVVLIFKKGDTKDLKNYRPISLLNTL